MKNDITPDFHIPTQIYIQQDILHHAADILSKYGSRILIICTSTDFEIFHETAAQLSTSLRQAGKGCIIYDQISGSINTEEIDLAVAFSKKTMCDLVIGFGGFESLNAAKAVALLSNNFIFCQDLFNYPKINHKPVKLVTIPAYPVFGLEISPLLFMDEIFNNTKKTYYNTDLFPVATIVDPSVSIKVSEEIAMKSSICTLAISAESVISRENNDIINTYALRSVDLIFRNLPSVFSDLQNISPRLNLATASIMSGIAFSVSYLSTSLAISLALTTFTEMTIESAMSTILPHIMEFNLTTSPGKYVQMSKVMGEDVKDITVIEAAIKTVEAIRKLETDIDIPQRLSNYNISKSEFQQIASLATSYPFIENAPRALNRDEIETILIASY